MVLEKWYPQPTQLLENASKISYCCNLRTRNCDVFQQDDYPAHDTLIAGDFSNLHFSGRWIELHGPIH